MKPQLVRNALAKAARSARSATFRPPLPAWAPQVCGVLTAAAIAIAAAVAGPGPGPGPQSVRWHLAALATGAAPRTPRIPCAARTPSTISPAVTVFLWGVAPLIGSLNAGPETRWLYAGLGVAGGVAIWIVLHRKARPCPTN
ncbi:MAG TPA: hypothetical protein VF062_21965 [Candidatus Limnocylindrales bacterium]